MNQDTMTHLTSIEARVEEFESLFVEITNHYDDGTVERPLRTWLRTTLTVDRASLISVIEEWAELAETKLSVPSNNEIISAALAGEHTAFSRLKTFLKTLK